MLNVRYSTRFKKDFRTCAIYKQTDDELRLDRTGTHADLFGL